MDLEASSSDSRPRSDTPPLSNSHQAAEPQKTPDTSNAADSLTARNTWDAPDRVALKEGDVTLRNGQLDAELPALSLTRMTFSAAE